MYLKSQCDFAQVPAAKAKQSGISQDMLCNRTRHNDPWRQKSDPNHATPRAEQLYNLAATTTVGRRKNATKPNGAWAHSTKTAR
jgi:hypothetical protein